MNPLDAQGLQGNPWTNAAAASSSGTSSSSSTDEKISQVVSVNESGPHAAAGASSQSLEGCKLEQKAPPPVVLDLSDEGLLDGNRIAYIRNSGGTVTLLKLGRTTLSRFLMRQIAMFCPQLKELEMSCSEWGLDQLIQVQSTLPRGVLLTNTSYNISNRKELQKYLDYCAPFGGPTCLNLQWFYGLTQDELDALIEGAPKLRSLAVGSCQLTELNAPNATEIYCRDCTGLQSLSAPKATKIYCGGCTGLQSISAPNATEIECRGCTSLQSLHAPNASRIDCSGCTSLQSICAPKATRIDCWDCTSLQSLHAPQATRINCWRCTGLQSISAPCATEIYCDHCTSLQSLSAPKATRVECGGCTGLQSLSAPKATRISCWGCKALQSLNVPLSAIWGWKLNTQRSLERLQMGAKMPDPEEMKVLEASHPELAQKMRKLTVLTLQDLVRNCIHENPQIETKDFPAPLLQYEDIETAYLKSELQASCHV